MKTAGAIFIVIVIAALVYSARPHAVEHPSSTNESSLATQAATTSRTGADSKIGCKAVLQTTNYGRSSVVIEGEREARVLGTEQYELQYLAQHPSEARSIWMWAERFSDIECASAAQQNTRYAETENLTNDRSISTQVVATVAAATNAVPTPVALPAAAAIPLNSVPSVPTVAKPSTSWAVVTGTRLNVRTGPASNYDVITTVDESQCFQVLDQTEDWARLALADGKSGWSSATYLRLTDQCDVVPLADVSAVEPKVQSQSINSWGVVNAQTLRVRSGPGTTYEIIDGLSLGDCVQLLTLQQDWMQIALTPDRSGWCAAAFMNTVEQCPPVDQVSASSSVQVVATQPALPSYVGQPMRTNSVTVGDTQIHECFGGGPSELRPVTSNTPVEVLGIGAFAPPAAKQASMGLGPYVKIRLWDGQYAWIASSAVNINTSTLPQVSEYCEPYDRIDWSTVVRPTPTPAPVFQPLYPSNSSASGTSPSCCKVCSKGKACGDSCISRSYSCHKGPGCACNG